MRLFAKLTGDRVHESRVSCSRDASASTRPPVFSSARALEAAIDAATFARREPNEDGERVIVFCNALGGAFIYSRKEAERRVMLNFPGLALEEVAAATRFLEDRMRCFLKPIQIENDRKSSWLHGWRYDH